MGGRPGLGGAAPAGASETLRARDVPVPLGRHAHGPRRELHHRRRLRPLLEDARPRRAASLRLRRLRAPGGERGHQARHPPAGMDLREHRALHGVLQAAGLRLRLGAHVQHLRSRLLPLEPVAVPAFPRAGAGLPQGGEGQLVPLVPDGARQRADLLGGLLAVRVGPRDPGPGAVVLPDHGLRPAAAGRHGGPRLGRRRPHPAAQLDRPIRGRDRPLHHRPDGGRDPGLHHPPRHAVRRHLLRVRAGAPDRRAARRPRRQGRGVRRLRGRDPAAVRDRAPGDGGAQAGLRPRGPRGQPAERGAGAGVRVRLRAHGVRDGGHHGRARPRPA